MDELINDEGRIIKCYDSIKLFHIKTGKLLKSCESYHCDWTGGSGPDGQDVYCSKQRDDNDWFVINVCEEENRY